MINPTRNYIKQHPLLFIAKERRVRSGSKVSLSSDSLFELSSIKTKAIQQISSKIGFSKKPGPKRTLALLIAAHNEELVIEKTIRSAIRAGMKKKYIYVVDDNSSDRTAEIVRGLLGADNILSVDRSGKGLAIKKATDHFRLCDLYEWIHIADADGGFARDYFAQFKKHLNKKFVAATGYIKSLPGGPVSQYRVVEYTLGMEIQRRFQVAAGTVSVIPGPTSCFRSDVFRQLNFANGALTEDFDVTLQIHRKKLGKIQFIPEAVAYTQDPRTIQDYIKQITRWNRGIIQGMIIHKVGLRPRKVDAYLLYQVSQNFLFFASYFIILPILAADRGVSSVMATTFVYDVAITFGIVLAVAVRTLRFDIISAFPHIYFLRWVSLYVFMKSFFEVAVLRKFLGTNSHVAWSTGARRYSSNIDLVTSK